MGRRRVENNDNGFFLYISQRENESPKGKREGTNEKKRPHSLPENFRGDEVNLVIFPCSK